MACPLPFPPNPSPPSSIHTTHHTPQTTKAEERIASLAGGVARIRVGAATEVELKDKKLRYEDAVNSVKNALKFGVLPGMRMFLGALGWSLGVWGAIGLVSSGGCWIAAPCS